MSKHRSASFSSGHTLPTAWMLATLLLAAMVGCEEPEVVNELTLSPETIDFGSDVIVFQKESKTFSLSNTGSKEVSLTEFAWVDDSGPFKVPDAEYKAIVPGDSVTFTVEFYPQTDEAVSASLSISHSADNSPALVTFTGQGFAPDEDQDGYTALTGDCDDTNPEMNPAATEVCNGIDDDCSGKVDDDASDAISYYPDEDGDGYGEDTWRPTEACEDDAPSGYASNNEDCNDEDASISPAKEEICDDTYRDENCDGQVDEGWDNENDDGVPDCYDQDGDGQTGLEGDCDDTDPNVYDGQLEQPANEIDDDCDEEIDENAAPYMEIISPSGEGDIVKPAPALITLSAYVKDDYDPASAVTVDFYSGSNPLCEDVVPDEAGIADCPASLELGQRELTFVARDSQGEPNSLTINVLADNIPEVTFVSPSPDASIPYGESTTFVITVVDEDGQEFEQEAVQWSSSLQGELTPDLVPPIVGEGEFGANIALTYPGQQTISARISDEWGAVGEATLPVTVLEPEGCGSDETIAIWHMDEGKEFIITDSVNGLVGELNDTLWQGSMAGFGEALQFNADNASHVVVDNSSNRLSLREFTIDFWVRPLNTSQGTPAARQVLVYKAGTSSTSNKANYYLSISDLGYASATITRSEGINMVAVGNEDNGATQLLSGDWYHFAATFDGRFLKVYINGEEQASADAGSNGTTPVTGTDSLYLGMNPNDSSPRPYTFTGSLDDLSIMECPLTADRIKTLADAWVPHPDPAPDSTPTPGPTPEESPTPDITPVTPTPEFTPTPDTTPTTPTPEESPTPELSPTPQSTPGSPTPEFSPTPLSTPGAPTPDLSPTPNTPTSTPSASPSPSPSETPEITEAPTPDLHPTASPAFSPTPEWTPSASPSSTPVAF